MHKFFSEKQVADHKNLNEEMSSESLFFEYKFVFMTVDSEDGSRTDADDLAEESQENPETPAHTEDPSGKNITDLQENFAGRYMKVLENINRNLPVDIDPNLIPNAKEVVLEIKSKIGNIDSIIANDIHAFMSSTALSGEETYNNINAILYEAIPRYKAGDLQKQQPANKEDLLSRVKIAKKMKEKLGGNIDSKVISQFISSVLPKLQEMAKYEAAMIAKIEEVQEATWKVNDALQKQEIKARKIKLAERYLGFPLKKGQKLECIASRTIINQETGAQESREYPEIWNIREINVDTKRRVDPEDLSKPGEAKLGGVWIALENNLGEIERLSPGRAKRFVDTKDLKPVCKSKDQINQNVPHLNDMGFEITEGMILEYDFLQSNNSGGLVAVPQIVKIISVDNQKVTLDREIIYRLQGSSTVLKNDDKKSTLTLSEFSKWLNQRNAIPQMNIQELNNAVYRHYDYMNKKYKSRKRDCHAPISIKLDEILYANAADSPLYRIESISENGMIQVSNKRPMTYPQFIRWIYANDIEPYNPELEEHRAKEYAEVPNNKAVKVGEETKEIIKYFKEHPDQYRRTREAWESSLDGKVANPEQAGKSIEVNMDIDSISNNFISNFWKGTHFLRISDLIEIFNTSLEFYKRRYERDQKSRYASVAKGLPYFGPEFKRIQTQAENEGTEYYKGIMGSYSTWQVEDILYETTNGDEMVASLFILSEKGMLRWDDPNLWSAINKFNDFGHQIPILQNHADPYLPFGKGTGRKFAGEDIEGKTSLDFLEMAMDNAFGDGMYLTLKRNNDGGISNGQSKAATKAAELESDPLNRGGLGKELEKLLASHMAGNFVDPTEFEGLLWYAFEGAGIGADSRVYFLLMALFAKNSRGRSLLGWERLGAFITKFGPSNFPIMDFFKGGDRRDLETGEFIKGRAFVRSDLEPIIAKWIANAHATNNYGASGKRVNEFVFQEVLTSRQFQNRLEKVIGEARAIDHEDAPLFIPALKESAIEDVTANAGGSRKKFSIAGYKNTYLGFGLRVHALVDKIKKESSYAKDGKTQFLKDYKSKLADTFRTFVRYDGIMDKRYMLGKGSTYQRLEDNDMADGCVYDPGTPLREYQKEMHSVLANIIDAYAKTGKISSREVSNMKRALYEKPDSTDKDAIANVDKIFTDFGATFNAMIDKDDGALMLEAVGAHGKFMAEKVLDISSDDMKANTGDLDEDSSV